MARARGIENIERDLTGNLERDFNIFIGAVLGDLSSRGKSISPIDTGFFMSSWTADTQRPRPDQAREEFAPWSNIKPKGTGDQRNSNAVVEPRFIHLTMLDLEEAVLVNLQILNQYLLITKLHDFS
jgi:hypothetical protein